MPKICDSIFAVHFVEPPSKDLEVVESYTACKGDFRVYGFGISVSTKHNAVSLRKMIFIRKVYFLNISISTRSPFGMEMMHLTRFALSLLPAFMAFWHDLSKGNLFLGSSVIAI
jgi:hypothetical protein